MVQKMTCAACLECLHEASLVSGNALELAASLSDAAQMHLQGCAACREACARSVQLEGALRSLSAELAVPDLRGAVMARIRAGEKAAVPALTRADSVVAFDDAVDLDEAPRARPAAGHRGVVVSGVRARVPAESAFGAREVVCVMMALTLGTAWLAPAWLPWFSALTDWMSMFAGFGLALPEVALNPARDAALLSCLMLACVWQTRSWMQVRHG